MQALQNGQITVAMSCVDQDRVVKQRLFGRLQSWECNKFRFLLNHVSLSVAYFHFVPFMPKLQTLSYHIMAHPNTLSYSIFRLRCTDCKLSFRYPTVSSNGLVLFCRATILVDR